MGTEIKKDLFSLDFESSKNETRLYPEFDANNFFKIRLFIYELLNRYENEKQLFICGVPYCALPDAYDHIVYRPSEKTLKIKKCGACRLNNICPGLEKDSFFHKNQTFLEPVLPAPGEVVIETNKTCNLNCVMCGGKSSGRETEKRKIFSVLEEARSLGVKNARFTGGEPTLRKDLPEMLRFSKKLGFYTMLNTNGLFGRAAETAVLKYADNILVSLHGFNDETEKRITRGGRFREKISLLKKLSSAVPVVRAGTIITRALAGDYDRHLELMEKTGVKIWELYRPMVKRDFAEKFPDFRIGPEDVKKLLKKISAGSAVGVFIANPVPFCLFREKYARHLLGARFDDGHTRIVYDCRGYFKPSYYIEKNLGVSVKSSWNSGFLRKTLSVSNLPEICKKCKYLLRCLNGSRYLAEAYDGSYSSPDPWFAPGKMNPDFR